jgi:hypothetical protein
MDYILKSKKIEGKKALMLDVQMGSSKDSENVSRKRVAFILK